MASIKKLSTNGILHSDLACYEPPAPPLFTQTPHKTFQSAASLLKQSNTADKKQEENQSNVEKNQSNIETYLTKASNSHTSDDEDYKSDNPEDSDEAATLSDASTNDRNDDDPPNPYLNKLNEKLATISNSCDSPNGYKPTAITTGEYQPTDYLPSDFDNSYDPEKSNSSHDSSKNSYSPSKPANPYEPSTSSTYTPTKISKQSCDAFDDIKQSDESTSQAKTSKTSGSYNVINPYEGGTSNGKKRKKSDKLSLSSVKKAKIAEKLDLLFGNDEEVQPKVIQKEKPVTKTEPVKQNPQSVKTLQDPRSRNMADPRSRKITSEQDPKPRKNTSEQDPRSRKNTSEKDPRSRKNTADQDPRSRKRADESKLDNASVKSCKPANIGDNVDSTTTSDKSSDIFESVKASSDIKPEKKPSAKSKDKSFAADAIVKCLMRYFKKGKICGRETFKQLARHLTHQILSNNNNPGKMTPCD